MLKDNIEVLQNTLQILKQGYYQVNGRTVNLKLSKKEMETIHVLLPEDVQDICNRTDFEKVFVMGRCGYGCENMDSFAAARQQYKRFSYMFWKDEKTIVLVLNFANPVHPGGAVRRGAIAQEEDLCRKSSLLLSLESRHAEKYYAYNRKLDSYMGSDAMMFTPEVEIIRDEDGKLLEETVIVAVLTCAAPMITQGREGMSEDAYQNMIYNRIMGMLKCAAYFGYKNIVLGAWGCGAFGNDAHMMSDLFYKALKEMRFNGLSEKDFFRRIDFAVLDRTDKQYNFKEFYRNFSSDNFYREENQKEIDTALQKIRETEVYLDKVRGSLFGGAVGDALGYPVEFFDEERILSEFGENGIREYRLDRVSGKALISDDTQMTLFTANGILIANTRAAMRGIGGIPHDYITMSYQDWLRTQEMTFEDSSKQPRGYMEGCISWLADVPELYSRRSPGHTCLSALRQYRNNKLPQNDSKGCGGIMRVAPLALKNYPYTQIKEIDREGAEIAKITHRHSLGYMPAAVLVHIISRIVYPNPENKKQQSLKEIVIEARDMVADIFADDGYLKKLTEIINLAVGLSENNESDIDNIHRIGEGWVAEETLGIAIYCSLRHQNDFSAGVTAAVNHRGDSDSTGAVTGNILGALIGYEAIEEKWKGSLELADVILEMADDLCHGCQMNEYSHYENPDWIRKYMNMRWKDGSPEGVSKTAFVMVKGDITKDHGVQAIVNAANTSLLGGGGVDGAIHRAAGPELLAECRLLSGCETGKAKITKAYRLPCEYVIHTPGPHWNGGKSKKEHKLLASCYQSCLELAVRNGIRSIAFPSIATGIYRFPLDEAAKIAVSTAKKFTTDHPGELDVIKWVLFDDETLGTYEKELEQWEMLELVYSSEFDVMNRTLRDGGM